MARTGVGVSAVVAWAVAVIGFGVLHDSPNSWLLDGAGGSLRDTLVTTALWAVFFGLVMWWSQRRAGRRG